jgi:two-component system, NarL family, sensor histidine kinase UhpB
MAGLAGYVFSQVLSAGWRTLTIAKFLGAQLKMLGRFWYDRSVRTQLLVAVAAINMVAAIVAAIVSVLNTRTATQLEIESSLEVAQRLVTATIKDLAAPGQPDQLVELLPLELKHLRHVRILMKDSSGQLVLLSSQPSATTDEGLWSQPPIWFSRLVRPKLAGRTVKVVAADDKPVVIVGEPADEIAEHWQNFRLLALVWLALEIIILGVLYVVLGRILNPLQSLSRGMIHLEDGDYATRLNEPKVKELAVITGRFNKLATALDVARDENARLSGRLIAIQEEERREIANELHDEAGPCLFGITANASSIKGLASGLPGVEIAKRAEEILSIAERLKLLNRTLLKKLRPASHGHVSLTDLIIELISGFERRHPDTCVIANISGLANSYGEAVDLTLYRSVQEGMTNAIRHGKATHLTIDLREERAPRSGPMKLRLVLTDNGSGMANTTPKGFGLTTMFERARLLGGTCQIEGEPNIGTSLRIAIPARSKRLTRPSVRQRAGALV